MRKGGDESERSASAIGEEQKEETKRARAMEATRIRCGRRTTDGRMFGRPMVGFQAPLEGSGRLWSSREFRCVR